MTKKKSWDLNKNSLKRFWSFLVFIHGAVPPMSTRGSPLPLFVRAALCRDRIWSVRLRYDGKTLQCPKAWLWYAASALFFRLDFFCRGMKLRGSQLMRDNVQRVESSSPMKTYPTTQVCFLSQEELECCSAVQGTCDRGAEFHSPCDPDSLYESVVAVRADASKKYRFSLLFVVS